MRTFFVILGLVFIAWAINQIWPPKLQVITYHSPSGIEYACFYNTKDEYELVTLENTHGY